jgi:hypothetical protein
MDKRIVAELIEGTPVIFMDNVNATLLRSNTLASIITERPSGVRELGKSRMIRLEHASFVILTGNGLAVGEDLARRFIYSRLDPRLEDPEARPFKPGFLEGIERRRGELLAAALTVWRWGRQTACSLKPGIALGSFETWGTWVRDPLLALGCQDPVAQIREIKARDPQRQKVAELYELWWEHHGDAPTKASELADELKAASIRRAGVGSSLPRQSRISPVPGNRGSCSPVRRAMGETGCRHLPAQEGVAPRRQPRKASPSSPSYLCQGRNISRTNIARGRRECLGDDAPGDVGAIRGAYPGHARGRCC